MVLLRRIQDTSFCVNAGPEAAVYPRPGQALGWAEGLGWQSMQKGLLTHSMPPLPPAGTKRRPPPALPRRLEIWGSA
jgi:hypothetical protein